MDTTGEEFALTATDQTLRELRETIEYVKSRADFAPRRRTILYPSGGGGKTGGEGAQGRLLSGITPCDNALTGATTFTFARYVEADIDPQTDPLTMMEEVDGSGVAVITTGVNRSPLELGVDGHVNCVKVNGEWVPFSGHDVCPG